MRSGSMGHGGFHQLFSPREDESARWRESTTSHDGSSHFALYRGSSVLRADANRSIVCGPN
jgi:hypothetical protein